MDAEHREWLPGGRHGLPHRHHFFPHGRFNSLGPADFVLDCLVRNNIPFTIHAPDI